MVAKQNILIFSFIHIFSIQAREPVNQLFEELFKKKPDIRKISEVLGKWGKKELKVEDDAGNTPLIHAAAKGDLDLVKLFIDCYADVKAKNEDGDTPLIYAVKGKFLEIVKILLDEGALVNAQNNEGRTALIFAALRKAVDIIKLLLKYGGDASIRDKYGQNALGYGRSTNDDEIRRIFRQSLAGPKPKDEL